MFLPLSIRLNELVQTFTEAAAEKVRHASPTKHKELHILSILCHKDQKKNFDFMELRSKYLTCLRVL
jgi:hypothetical protein